MTTPSKQRPAVGKKCGKSPQARYACFVIFHSANKNLMLSELGNSAEVVVNDDDDQTTVGKKCGKGPERRNSAVDSEDSWWVHSGVAMLPPLVEFTYNSMYSSSKNKIYNPKFYLSMEANFDLTTEFLFNS